MTGSFLWVNGLRENIFFQSFPTVDSFQRLSWFRKDNHFVCVAATIPYDKLIPSTAQASSKMSETYVGLD